MKEKKTLLAIIAVLLSSTLLLSLLLTAIPAMHRTVRFTPESSLPADTTDAIDTSGIIPIPPDTLTTDVDVDPFDWEVRDYSMENFFRVYQDLSDDIPVMEISLPFSPEEESYGMRMIVDQGYLNDVQNIFNETVKGNLLKKKDDNLLILGTHSYTFHLNPQTNSESFILYDGGYLEYNGYLYEVNEKYLDMLLDSYRTAPEFSHCIVGNYEKAFRAENILYEELGLTYVMKDESRYITPFTYEAIDYYWDNIASFDHVLENDDPILSLSSDEIIHLYDYVSMLCASGYEQIHLTAYFDPILNSEILLDGGGTPVAYHEIVTPDLENSVRTLFIYFLHMLSSINSFLDLSLLVPDDSTGFDNSSEWDIPSFRFVPEGDELLYFPQMEGVYDRKEAMNRWFYGDANESPLPCWVISLSEAGFYPDFLFVVDVVLPF